MDVLSEVLGAVRLKAAFYFEVNAAKREAPFTLVEIGGAGNPAKFVCGYLGCDARPFNPLLSALPSMLIVKDSDRSGELTRNLVLAAFDENESRKAGSETMLAKLSELMFIQALRRHIDSLPPDSTGWLSGLRDARIGSALQLIHTQPAESWTPESLARASGTSRSKLAERFHAFTGESPMRYLARWRMQLACRMLGSSTASIAQVGERQGYSSEAAFKRAFKKYVGDSPGSWRRAR